MTGKEAYEEDVKRRPNYHDGACRKTWEQLGTVERWTWERNPTPRPARKTTALAALALLCLSALPALAGEPAGKAVRAKPISTISVKVQPAAKMEGKLWRITTADADSCVAWVSTTAPNLEQAEVAAFRECRKAINLAVDTAHGKAEQGRGQR